jgi:hypothetical protein
MMRLIGNAGIYRRDGNRALEGVSTVATSRPTPPKKRRPFFTFSLRFVFALQAIVCVALASWIVPSIRQRDAVERLTAKGATFLYDYETNLAFDSDVGYPVPVPPPWHRAIVGKYVGKDFAFDVVSVRFEDYTMACDDDILCLLDFPRLKWVSIEGAEISDAAMASVGQLKHLESVSVWDCKITNAALIPIGRLSNLTELALAYCPITDEGLAQMQNLQNLEDLCLYHTQVNGTGLSRLSRNQKLRDLTLSDCSSSPVAIVNFANFSNLKRLYLQHTQINDDDVAHLIGLANLETLDLSGTKITDGCINHLQKLPRLKWLYLRWTMISPEGVQRLNEAFPSSHVWAPDVPLSQSAHGPY